MNTKQNKLVPQLRFPEFNDNLKNIGFNELGKIMIGLTHTPNYIHSGVKFLSSKNISRGYIDFDDVQHISEEEFSNMSNSAKPIKGDILFTRVGSNLGNPIVLEVDLKFAIFVSLGVFRVKKEYSNYFVKYWMDTNIFWRQVEQKVAGGAKNNLNTTWLKEFKLSIPSLPEQQKIAAFLTAIDDKITQLTKKAALLEQYKKGVMRNIFSQELRFKPDVIARTTDEAISQSEASFPKWEEKKLGDISKCLDNKRIPLNEAERNTKQGSIPYWGANGILDYVDEYIFDETIVLLAEDGGYFQEFQTRPIANISYGKSWVNNHAHVIKAVKGLTTNEYLYYSLVHKNILGYINGGTRAKLNKSEMLKIKMVVPSSIEEQTKIANFLSAIDIKIEALNTQIEHTKAFKKGLLQQLFV